MRRVLFKAPGDKAEERRISTRDEAIRELIGCTYETRFEWTDEGWGPAAVLCANQETARALNYPAHMWFYTGTIAGPIIIINRLLNGQYLDLTDEDISRWQVKLSEFEEAIEGSYVHDIVSKEEEVRRRREHSWNAACSTNDDFAAVLRLQAEIEQRIRERIICKMPHPERLGRSIRLELRQALAIAAALGAIPPELVRPLQALGEVRNLFAHQPGYLLTSGDVNRLKQIAESSGFDDTRWAFDQGVDETVHMSEESRDLRMIYNQLIVELDDEVIAMREGHWTS